MSSFIRKIFIITGLMIFLNISSYANNNKNTILSIIKKINEINTLKYNSSKIMFNDISSNEDIIIKGIKNKKFHLKFFKVNGYFRQRFNYFYRCDLNTFIKSDRFGTSNFFQYIIHDKFKNKKNNKNIFSIDIRFRFNTILNISDSVRVKSQIDIYDNLILGSSFYDLKNINKKSLRRLFLLRLIKTNPSILFDDINQFLSVKRLFGELSTSIGNFRFGRMPISFGLGLVYDSGDKIDDNFSDTLDGILFATKFLGHYLIPAYYMVSTNIISGYSDAGKKKIHNFLFKRKYNVNVFDNIHIFFLTISKKTSLLEKKIKFYNNKIVFDYAMLILYKFQKYDFEYVDFSHLKLNKKSLKMINRNSNIGTISMWSNFYWKSLFIESEFSFIYGKINYKKNLNLIKNNKFNSIFVLKSGAALKGSYSLMSSKLRLFIEIGAASGNDNAVLGSNSDFLYKKFSIKNNKINNFVFNENYKIDLLLFKRIINGISGSYYLKPSIFYKINKKLTLNINSIFAFSNDKIIAIEKKSFLGLEFNSILSFKVLNGFCIKMQPSLVLPFSGLNHSNYLKEINRKKYSKYSNAKTAFGLNIIFYLKF